MPDAIDSEKDSARRWRERSRYAFASSWALFHSGDYWGFANRAYYAAYQACTSVCVAHGDADNLPAGWNNPSHERLADLIQNIGDRRCPGLCRY